MPRGESSKSVDMVSPLYSAGVHHATVHSPTTPHGPDPMGYLAPHGHEASWMTAGGGDDVNNWKEQWPDQKNIQGQTG